MSSVANTCCDVVAAARNDLMYCKVLIIISYYDYLLLLQELISEAKRKEECDPSRSYIYCVHGPPWGMVY